MATISSAAAAGSAQRRFHRRTPLCFRSAGRTTLKGGVRGQSIVDASSVNCCSRSGMGRLLDASPQASQRAREPRLDSAFGNAKGCGGFLAVEFEEVAACDHQAVVLAE